MNIPTLPVQTKPVLWGVAAGAIAISIIGFNWGGWMTGTAAETFAKKRADAAVVSALAPICVDQFQKSADATTNLAALKEIENSWEQRKYIGEGGWATMPGSNAEPNREVAAACAEELNELVLQEEPPGPNVGGLPAWPINTCVRVTWRLDETRNELVQRCC